MQEFEFRQSTATLKDITDHLQLCKEYFSPPLNTYTSIPEYALKIKSKAVTFEAWKHQELIGLVACYINLSEKIGYITNVSTIKKNQGTGIATNLLNTVFTYAAEQNLEKVQLHTNSTVAQNFYSKLGFKIESQEDNRLLMTRKIKEESNITISICCITYNHENYIRETLNGFVMQKTNFNYEVLIHDDASTDKTPLIIKEFEKKYPSLIKPIYQKENQYSKGILISAKYNFPRAKGRYIAICEGDDHWTDPNKLFKQVSALEANPEINISYHPVSCIGVGNLDITTLGAANNKSGIIEPKELLKQGLHNMPSCSLMIRTSILRDPQHKEFIEKHGTSFFLKLLPAHPNGAFLINEIMGNYRVGAPGSHTQRTKDNFKLAYKYLISVNKAFYLANKITKHAYSDEISSITKRRSINTLNRTDVPMFHKFKIYFLMFNSLNNKERIFLLPFLGRLLTTLKSKMAAFINT